MLNLSFKNALVPFDFSPHAAKALDRVLDDAADPASVTVLHVGALKSGYVDADPALVWEAISNEQREEALQAEFLAQSDDPRRQNVRFQVAFGAPADEIARHAEQHECDLIVMPSHGRTGLTRLLLGSVAEGVVRQAHCPVLILRD